MSGTFFKKYISLISVNVPEKYKTEFKLENTYINILRVRNISIILMVISLSVGVFLYLYEKKTHILSTPHAIEMHAVLFAVSLVFSVAGSLVNRKKNDYCKFTFSIDKLFIIIFLLWTMVFSIDSQAQNGQITVYILGITAIAAGVYLDPLIVATVYLVVNSAFFIALPHFQHSEALIISHKINAVCLILLAWLISKLNYQNRLNDFIQRKLIDEQNAALIALNTKLQELSYIDSLTGIPNRRDFERRLEIEMKRAIRANACLTVALVDIDYFKTYNDYYGHIAGDECIKLVANTMSETVKKPGDFIARFGGEEFVLIFPETGSKGAEHICEKIRLNVGTMPLINPNSTKTNVTISIGIFSKIPAKDDTGTNFINNADKALYQAKNQGRNKVVLIENTN